MLKNEFEMIQAVGAKYETARIQGRCWVLPGGVWRADERYFSL